MQLKNILFILILIVTSQAVSGQCFEDRHNANSDNSWLSCTPSPNPNDDRLSPSHWIMYELDEIKQVHDLNLWNYNHVLDGANGINEFTIDVSTDGVEWTDAGTFNMPESQGSAFYEGLFAGRLDGRSAKYILITAVSNHGGSCFGFSEIKINLESTQDIAPSLRILPSIANGPTEMFCVLKVLEVAGKDATGDITIIFPKDNKLQFEYDQNLTTVEGTDLNNPDWVYDDSNSSFHIWTTSQGVSASGQSSIGVIATFDPAATNGSFSYTATVIQGSGDETNFNNNIDAETLVFFSGN